MIFLKNYLTKLDADIKIFGMERDLQRLHQAHTKNLLNLFKKKVHISTYYYWLTGKSPISLKYLKMMKKFDGSILDNTFSKMGEVSIGRKKCILPKKIDNDLAYFLGALHGDGSLHKNKKFVTITNESKGYLRKIIIPLAGKIFKTTCHFTDLGGCFRGEIGSKPIHSFLSIFCPIGKKKGLLRIPKEIFNNQSLLKSYLAGLFDTDGCLTHIEKKRKHLFFCFVQADKRFTMEVYSALQKLGVNVNKPKQFLSPSYPYATGRNLIEWRIYIGSRKTLQTFLSIIKFRYSHKKRRAEMILRKLKK